MSPFCVYNVLAHKKKACGVVALQAFTISLNKYGVKHEGIIADCSPRYEGNMAYIRKRTDKKGVDSYAVEVSMKGHPTQYGTFKNKTTAKKWANDVESAIRAGRFFKETEAKKHTVAEMIDRYIENAKFTPVQDSHAGLHLRRWRDEIGFMTLADLTPDTITRVKETLSREIVKGKPRSDATVLKYMVSFGTVLNVAVRDWAWLEDSPMRNIRKPSPSKGIVRFLDDDERERLLLACKESRNPVLYTCVTLSLATGMRQSELMWLTWQDVDLARGVIILPKTKNGSTRRVPLAGFALNLLRDYAATNKRAPANLLFPSAQIPSQPVELKKSWQTALKKANVTNFRWHDLRHSTASYMVMNGSTLGDVGAVLGHKSIQMTSRYAHLSENHLTNVVSSMNDKIFGGIG
jgi:integrase